MVVTDKLKSYAAANRETMPGVEHVSIRGLTIEPRTPASRRGDVIGR